MYKSKRYFDLMFWSLIYVRLRRLLHGSWLDKRCSAFCRCVWRGHHTRRCYHRPGRDRWGRSNRWPGRWWEPAVQTKKFQVYQKLVGGGQGNYFFCSPDGWQQMQRTITSPLSFLVQKIAWHINACGWVRDITPWNNQIRIFRPAINLCGVERAHTWASVWYSDMCFFGWWRQNIHDSQLVDTSLTQCCCLWSSCLSSIFKAGPGCWLNQYSVIVMDITLLLVLPACVTDIRGTR